MKYGVVVEDISVRNQINIGNDMQGWAVYNILLEMGIDRDDITAISYGDLRTYGGEYIILPVNLYAEEHSLYEVFPLSPRIIPVFIGLHYRSGRDIKPEIADYLRRFQPIGCRDEYTMENLRRAGVQAYLFGCLTATMPKSEVRRTPRKIYCVDAPESIKAFIPKRLTDRYEVEDLSHIVKRDSLTPEERLDILKSYITKYSTDAALVITSRLHCLVPCLAMGTPVVAAFENRSERLSWLDKLIPLYTVSEFGSINWDAGPVDLEDIKLKMKAAAKALISDAAKKYDDILNISYYWETREKGEYGNVFTEILSRSLKSGIGRFDYIIWGTGAVGKRLYEAVSELYPEGRMVCAIDSYDSGLFYGAEIRLPDARRDYPGAIIFVASYTGRDEIERQLTLDNMVKGKDYFLFSLTTG